VFVVTYPNGVGRVVFGEKVRPPPPPPSGCHDDAPKTFDEIWAAVSRVRGTEINNFSEIHGAAKKK